MPRNDWTCPVCAQPNTADALKCINCLCSVDANELDIKQSKQYYAGHIDAPESRDNSGSQPLPNTRKRSLLGYFGIFMVLVPFVMVATSYTLAYLIPDCRMGGAYGAHGCGVLNPLFSFIGFWGAIYLVLGIGVFICIVLPAWVIGVAWKDFRDK